MPSIVVTPTTVAATLAAACCGSGVTLTGTPVYTGNALAAGTYTGGTDADIVSNLNQGSLAELDTGLILATGRAIDAQGPNIAANTSTDFGTVGTSGDLTSLSLSFVPIGPVLKITFLFGSEEYPEFASSSFADSISILIDGVNVALIPSTSTTITIRNVNATHNATWFVPNGAGEGISYDGLVKLYVLVDVTAGDTHTCVFTVQDVTDGLFDSGLLVGLMSSTPVGEACYALIDPCQTGFSTFVTCVGETSLMTLTTSTCDTGFSTFVSCSAQTPLTRPDCGGPIEV